MLLMFLTPVYPLGSVGLVYLPTFKYIYHKGPTKCRYLNNNIPYMDPKKNIPYMDLIWEMVEPKT